jgi:hypothetical protein
MSVQNLANAPLIDTDIPTAEPFYDRVIAAGSAPGADINRRYFPSAGTPAPSVMAMDNLPNSFGVSANQKGILAAFNVQNYDGTQMLRVAMRKPTVTLRDYTTGWDDLPELTIPIPVGTTDVSFTAGIGIASQRQGQFAYVFRHFISRGTFSNSISLNVSKVTRDEYVESAGVAGGVALIDGDATDDTEPLISAVNNGQFFVSDEETPFIWNVYGGVQGGNTAYISGFRDDNSQNIGDHWTAGNGILAGTHFMRGQSAAFYQEMTLPAGRYGYGPYLVHPWSSGQYDAPELWYMLYEFDGTGQTTGRFVIYRARWKKSQYVKTSLTFADDADYEAGRTTYPHLNPLGYAFERDVFNDAHRVGVIGPFQEIPVYNPQGNVVARFQNSGNTTITKFPLTSPLANALGFNVVRDTKRLNVMHMVIADGGSYPTDANMLNRIWYVNSSDDGAVWGRISQIGPGIVPDQQGTPGIPLDNTISRTGIPTKTGLLAAQYVGYEDYLQTIDVVGVPPVVRTHDDVLLMGNLTRFKNYTFADGSSPRLHSYPDDHGARISFAVVDYTGLGAADYARQNVFFVQKVQAGQIAWQ